MRRSVCVWERDMKGPNEEESSVEIIIIICYSVKCATGQMDITRRSHKFSSQINKMCGHALQYKSSSLSILYFIHMCTCMSVCVCGTHLSTCNISIDSKLLCLEYGLIENHIINCMVIVLLICDNDGAVENQHLLWKDDESFEYAVDLEWK